MLNFMKSLADQGIAVPFPSLFTENDITDLHDRRETGRQLLRWFLYDGKIRGVTPDGEIFEHRISTKLAKIFIERLKIGCPLRSNLGGQ